MQPSQPIPSTSMRALAEEPAKAYGSAILRRRDSRIVDVELEPDLESALEAIADGNSRLVEGARIEWCLVTIEIADPAISAHSRDPLA